MASQDTLFCWTKDAMRVAGIDLNIFSPDSTRSLIGSKATLWLPLPTNTSTVGWSRESTFTKYYRRPISDTGNFSSAILL
ncbi:hypothetical protein E2C01_049033 [Portunus trituberculatus]|uniref:Uncharacterized protein n=1 Tax=Portunus trituberculatus TaxID=210409 RepID=A0A5B7GBS6_PORTR|nr:hypothetical protein [Portunus trituberculatus]